MGVFILTLKKIEYGKYGFCNGIMVFCNGMEFEEYNDRIVNLLAKYLNKTDVTKHVTSKQKKCCDPIMKPIAETNNFVQRKSFPSLNMHWHGKSWNWD